MGSGGTAASTADTRQAAAGGWRTATYLGLAAVLAASRAAQDWPGVWTLGSLAVVLPAGVVGILRRRRQPWLLPLVGCVDALAGLGVFLGLGLFALVLRRRDRITGAWGVLAAAAVTIGVLASPSSGTSVLTITLLTWAGALLVQVAGPMLLGAWIGTQRELVSHLGARARAAEAERELRARQAVLHERERIAQEMHDSLGHQLALVTMHAGALEVNPDAGPTTVARQAALIRTTARQALVDLRRVVGALSGPDAPAPDAGRPRLADVRELVDRSRAAAPLAFTDTLQCAASVDVPEALARATYRIVQEGLTNAHRHAPGAPIRLTIGGGPSSGLTITVVNRLAPSGNPSGNGTGLTTLAERVRVLGGTFRAGPRGDEFALSARLPWPAPDLGPVQ